MLHFRKFQRQDYVRGALAAAASLCLVPWAGQAADAVSTSTDDPGGWRRWFLDPPKLSLGPVDIHPRLTTGMTYDDNITISHTNPKADEIWSVAPGVQLVAGDRHSMAEFRLSGVDALYLSPLSFLTGPAENWPGIMAVLDYAPQFEWYTHYSNNDCVNQYPTLNAIFPLGRVILGVRQSYSYANTTVIEAGQLTPQTTYNTALTSGYQVSDRTSLEVNLRRNSVSYSESTLSGYADYSNDNWIHYQVGDRLNLGGGVTAGYLNVENRSSQTYQQVLARALYKLAEKVDVDGSLGVEFRQYSTDIAGTTHAVFNLTGSYRPWLATTFSLNAHRWDLSSVSYGDNYMQTGFTLGVSQRLFDRLSVGLSGGYDNYSYYSVTGSSQAAANNQNNNYFNTRVGVGYRFNPFLNADVFYRFSQQSYETAAAGFSDNQIGLQVTYGF
jgi:hypothetical protein